jgi:Bacterial Ig-like domain (group 3)/FG-GAP-like repeat/FG-GAP repeat
MTHKFSRRYSLGVVAAFFVILIAMFAPAAVFAAAQGVPLHFSKPIPYDPGGASPESVAVADVNGDGHLDLVVAYLNEGSVGVLLGNGDGTFQPAVKYNSGGSGAISVAVADVNVDGKPDIVVLNAIQREGTVGVLLGNGDGTFQAPVTYDTGDYSIPEAVAVGDLNGDGHPDIAVANFGHDDCDCNDGRVGILWGNGDGTFQPTVFYPSGGYDNVSVTFQYGLLLVINLCWDQYCDYPNGNVCVNGACYDSGGMDPDSVAMGDLNGDGHPDIVVANSNPNPNTDHSMTLGVLLNDGWGYFQPAVLYNPGGDYPVMGAVADLNGDGKADIVVGTRSGTSVLLGNGDGAVQPPVIVGPFIGGYQGGTLIAADLNGDGKPDLIGIRSVMLNTSGFATTTHVTSSLNPSFIDQSVTFTATVTSRHGAIPDGGLVNFYDGPDLLGSAVLSGGAAEYSTSFLSAKAHFVKAIYAGGATLAPSKRIVEQIVLKYATTTKITSSPNPSTYGQPVTFTATVTSSGLTPTGKVWFFDGPLVVGPAALSNGVATLTWSKLLTGGHAITAEYHGDRANAASASSVLHQKVE